LEDGIEVDEITAKGITIDGKKPSLEGHTHDIQDVAGLEDELGQIDSTLSNHLADTNNPHGVTPEQIGAVSHEDLEDGLEVDEISANNLTIDGKKPSLEGHTHEMDEVSGLLDRLDGKIDLSAMGFATFDPTLTYQVGNTVAYNGHAYICSTQHTGSWDATHFDEMYVLVNRTLADGGLAIGSDAKVYQAHATSVGHGAEVFAERGTAIGYNAKVAAGKTSAIQLGAGTNQ